MPNFNLDDYEPVEDRLARFWADHPGGRVHTVLLPAQASNEFIVYACVYRKLEDGQPFATGLAHEVIGQGMVNRTAALENCETSAIGRALANGGYATKGKRPSREEMAKAAKPEAKAKPEQEVRPEDVEGRVKATVVAAVQNAYRPWTPKMVKDACARHYPAALAALEIGSPTVADADRIAAVVLDLIAAETK